MTNPILGYDNLIEDGTVSVTSEATGYEKENAYEWQMDTAWQADAAGNVFYTIDFGSAVTIDCWGWYSPDLHSRSGNIKPQYSTDNFSADTNDADSAQSPSTSVPVLRPITSQTKRYWRFNINATSAAKFIYLFFGQKLEMEQGLVMGFRPIALGSQYKVENSEAENGIFLGRKKRKMPIRASLQFNDVNSASWMRSNWPTLLAELEDHPFFVLPEPDAYPGEAAVIWTDGDIPIPSYTHAQHFNLTIPIKGVRS